MAVHGNCQSTVPAGPTVSPSCTVPLAPEPLYYCPRYDQYGVEERLYKWNGNIYIYELKSFHYQSHCPLLTHWTRLNSVYYALAKTLHMNSFFTG